MKTKDIAKSHGLDRTAFENWLKQSKYAHGTGGMGGMTVDDGQDIAEIVSSFRQYQGQQQERISQQRGDAAASC